jgi:hypothetical protein
VVELSVKSTSHLLPDPITAFPLSIRLVLQIQSDSTVFLCDLLIFWSLQGREEEWRVCKRKSLKITKNGSVFCYVICVCVFSDEL